MPSRTLGLAITGGLVAVAAVVGGAILYTSSRASEVNLTTASLVPEDAGFYFALNTDLTSSQWVNTFKLIERLGEEDPEDQLKDGVDEQGGLDWEDEVAPFLGGNAAVFVRGIDIGNVSAEGAVIIRCNDAEAAMEVIDDELGLGNDDEYEGVEYFELEDGSGYVARLGDHIVLSPDEDTLEDVIDVYNGDEPSLASRDDFQKLRDELTGNFLGFVYLSSENLLGDAFLDDPAVRKALEESGSGDLAFQPAAWVLGAGDDGFNFQAASLGESGNVAPMLAPRDSKLVRLVPADAMMFFSTTEVAQTYKTIVDAARDEIDEVVRQDGEYDSLEEAMRDCGSEVGLGSCEEIIALFEGESAFAAWSDDGTQDSFQGLLLAEVDEAKAKAILEKIVRADEFENVRNETINGHDFVTFRSVDDDEDGAYAFLDGVLLVGTRDAVEAVLTNDEPTLDQLNRYRDAVDQMPSSLGTFGFFDMGQLLRLAEGGIPADLDEAEEALSALIINIVDERDVVRVNGILTIEE